MRRAGLIMTLAAALLVAAGTLARAAASDPVDAARERLQQVIVQLDAARSRLEDDQRTLVAWNARLDRAEHAIWTAEQLRQAGLRRIRIGAREGVDRPQVGHVPVDEARARLMRVQRDPQVVAVLADAAEASGLVGKLTMELSAAQGRVEVLTTPGVVDPGAAEPSAGTWAGLFLRTIGAPNCLDNRIALVAWQAQEGTSARYNPLATTYLLPGATAYNDVGVRNYVTIGQGLEATAATLALPTASYGYGSVVASLRACAPAETTAWYVNASAWCRGCSDGAYLTRLVPLVRDRYGTYAERM